MVTSNRNGTLYVGVTSSLYHRIYEHKAGLVEGFSKEHGCKYLAYFELFASLEETFSREKQLKGYSRKKKLALIEGLNPEWRDLYHLVTPYPVQEEELPQA